MADPDTLLPRHRDGHPRPGFLRLHLERIPGDEKGENLGLYSSATLIGRSLAPILGGAVISFFASLAGDWSYRLVYVAAFVLAAPAFALSLSMPRDSGASCRASGKVSLGEFGRSLLAFAKNGRLLGTALVEMATYFTYGAFETYLPLYLQGRGLPSYQIGLVFSLQILAIALSKPLFGRLSDRIDRRAQILAGIVVLGGSFALIPLVSGIAAATAIGIVFGLGLSFSTVATSSYVADVASEDSLGASIGALSSIMDIGQSAGPLVVGVIVGASSLALGFLARISRSAWPAPPSSSRSTPGAGRPQFPGRGPDPLTRPEYPGIKQAVECRCSSVGRAMD